MKKTIILTALLFILKIVSLNAQPYSDEMPPQLQGGLIIKVFHSIPMGRYSDKQILGNSGFTNLGYGGGLEYETVLGRSNFKLFCSADGIFHPINEADVENMLWSVYGTRHKVDVPTNISLPVIVGLKYAIMIGKNSEFQFFAGGGVNYFIPSNYDMMIYKPDQDIITGQISNGNAVSMGLKVGCGIISNKVTFHVNYFNLGEAKYTQETKYSNGEGDNSISAVQAISMLLISMGIRI